jgi:hydrogenase maturation protease
MEARVTVIGYGNPGRLDDGLGPALIERLEAEAPDGVALDSNYQLNIEDAEAISRMDVAVFADAAVDGDGPFYFKKLQPGEPIAFTSHAMDAASVLRLAQDLFKARTKAYALGIRGYEFNEFGERLSAPAQANLEAALLFLKERLKKNDFEAHAA